MPKYNDKYITTNPNLDIPIHTLVKLVDPKRQIFQDISTTNFYTLFFSDVLPISYIHNTEGKTVKQADVLHPILIEHTYLTETFSPLNITTPLNILNYPSTHVPYKDWINTYLNFPLLDIVFNKEVKLNAVTEELKSLFLLVFTGNKVILNCTCSNTPCNLTTIKDLMDSLNTQIGN